MRLKLPALDFDLLSKKETRDMTSSRVGKVTFRKVEEEMFREAFEMGHHFKNDVRKLAKHVRHKSNIRYEALKRQERLEMENDENNTARSSADGNRDLSFKYSRPT